MKVVIASDSFKGSLSSLEVAEAVGRGILRVCPEAEIVKSPVADGGEGTVEALTKPEFITYTTATGPLGIPRRCRYGIIEGDGGALTAVIEMSEAAGLPLVPESERNPLYTTTFGVGEIIRDAIWRQCRNFIIGIGGSATNDGGLGMLQALGFRFLDAGGRPLPMGADSLELIASIGESDIASDLAQCSFNIACDVRNPLCGENGCSAVYGPQKGASPDMIPRMDAALARYARMSAEFAAAAPESPIKNRRADPDFPGAGAAGGIGFAFMAYLGGRLLPGVELILEQTKLEEHIKGADLVITGEGRIDAQTSMGKAPAGVAALAKKHGAAVVALCGCVGDGAELCSTQRDGSGGNIDAIFPIVRGACSLEEAMDKSNAAANTTAAAEQVMRLIMAAKNI